MKKGQRERALQLEQEGAEDQRREGKDDHAAHRQHGPRENRHASERHARRPRAQNPHDELDRSGNGRDLDEADPEEPEVSTHPGGEAAARERRVHEPPAIRRPAGEQRREEGQAADGIGPEGVGVQARERQISGAEHPRQQVDAHRLHDRHREQEHHHAAMHGEHLVVGVGTHHRIARHRKLRAYHQPEDAAEHEEHERRPEVEQPDARVVARR